MTLGSGSPALPNSTPVHSASSCRLPSLDKFGFVPFQFSYRPDSEISFRDFCCLWRHYYQSLRKCVHARLAPALIEIATTFYGVISCAICPASRKCLQAGQPNSLSTDERLAMSNTYAPAPVPRPGTEIIEYVWTGVGWSPSQLRSVTLQSANLGVDVIRDV